MEKISPLKKCSFDISTQGTMLFALAGCRAWENDGPFVVLHYYDRQHPRAQEVVAPSHESYSFGTAGTPSLLATGSLSVTEGSVDDDWHVVADFSQIGIRLEFVVRLLPSADGFTITLAPDGLHESVPGLYRILGIEVLPGFGAAITAEKGYLTLPNWSGCQTFFNKAYPREIRQTIYSSNDQWENVCNMPVFGITREQGTFCGMVTSGDFDAQLVCRVHWEERHTNGVHPQLVFRWHQEDEILKGAREVRYYFSPPDGPDGEGYVFCAKKYREFLFKERGLLTWNEKAKVRPAILDYRDRFFLKIFMAYKEPEVSGRGFYHCTTNFDEVRMILESCLARGMSKMAVMLVGWGQDGHDGMPPTRFPVDERLGGETAMKRLIEWCKARDILLGVHDSYGESYTCSPEFDPKDCICHRSGEIWQGVIWSGGQVHKLCPSIYIEKHVKRDIPRVKELGIHGHHHIDAVGSFVTCYSPEHPLEHRFDYIKQVRKMFEFASDTMGSVSTEMPFGVYFDVVDGIYHSYTQPSPWHRASSIGRYFLDRTIPLLPIVLHGSVNCCESVSTYKDSPLQWLDWGLCPQSEVAMRAADSFGIPAYESVAEDLYQIYEKYYGSDDLIGKLSDLTIEGRWENENGINVTKYSNGISVLVNSGSRKSHGLVPGDYRIECPEKAE